MPGATGKVYVVPAGAMGWSYVEKVARLDFSSHTESNESTGGAVHDGLRALLKGIRGSKNPDWVLLDARTGIHDLGGLAIHALAHIDVLIGRADPQGLEGLKLCTEALIRRRSVEEILTLIVLALVPAPLDDEMISVPFQSRFRQEVYNIFLETMYEPLQDDEIPAQDDAAAAHAPYPVPMDTNLARAATFRSMVDVLNYPHYKSIVERLRELATPEE